jgi:hypothetical protein
VILCYNCYRLGHIAPNCLKPKRANLKEICKDKDKEEVLKELEKEEL